MMKFLLILLNGTIVVDSASIIVAPTLVVESFDRSSAVSFTSPSIGLVLSSVVAL